MLVKKRLPALDGLRVLDTMGIFLFHSGFLPHGTFPVTLFFMLSGFMMYYTKYDTITPMTGIRKMKRMYPLHVITFLISILIWHPWTKLEYSMKYLLEAGVMHLTLTQAWLPKYTYTYNGLAWYLSVTLFLYAVSYPLVRLVRKVKKTVLWILFLWLVILGLDIYLYLYGGVDLYSNPIYRMFDYVLGMMLAKQFQEHSFLEKKRADKTEIGLVILFIIQYILSFRLGDTPGYYIILFSVVLYILAVGQGCVSRFLSKHVFYKLASYSFEFYMVHELGLRIFRKIFPEMQVFTRAGYIIREIKISGCSLVISILFVWIYKNYSELKLRLV